jgi:error-prone DNA polymerase
MYVPLRVRSNYSLLSGASSIDAVLDRAAAFGVDALAVTDEANLYGAVPFFEKARARGVRPVLGAIVDEGGREVVLLARDRTGYANLCEIISLRRLDDENAHERFSLEKALLPRQAGLFVLVRDAALLGRLARDVDADRLRAEVVRPAIDVNAERALLETAQRLGIGAVGAAEMYFARDADFELHEALSAMKLNTALEEARSAVASHAGARLRSPEEMRRLFFDMPDLVDETARVAEACDFDLLGLPPVFPKLPGDSAAQLREDAYAGARSRYMKITREARERIDRELDLIARLGFPDYFLVVADIVRHARELGTPVAGRGSGASSVVAYALGITNVDPLKYDLPFERFLNEGRTDFPDLDIDFCWRLRDSVIDYVYKKYGDEHAGTPGRSDLHNLRVAMISTYATMRPRLAFREVAKTLGMSVEVTTEVMKCLTAGLAREKWRTLPVEPERVDLALRLAKRLEGFPHHLSLHCGGVVITPGPIARHAPLERAAKGVVVTQYDKDGVEAVGLVKLDLLGNRALSSISESVRLAAGRGERVDPETLPERDLLTEKLLASGDTVGVNQLESPAMRHLVRQIAPKDVKGLMQVLALIRPGAASLGMKEQFVRRARGIDPIPEIDPRLDHILRGTHGVMLYEDDALFIASELAGLPPAKADRFRRAVTKTRTDEERLALSREFLSLCERNNVNPKIAADLWVQMAKFNAYSFCRAHAASYARLAWANAYMKAHHPAEFWVAALNNNEGLYPRWVYIEEAKRAGIRALLPCVNRSGDEFALSDGAIRTGLLLVKGLSARARGTIIKNHPFAGLVDLVARTSVKTAEVEALVRCGALDFTGRARPALLLELYAGFKEAKKLRGQGDTLFRVPDAPSKEELGRYSDPERWRDEWQVLGIATGRHPVAWIRPRLEKMGAGRSAEALGRPGTEVRLAGIVAAGRTAHTEKGETMAFLTLSDEEGLFEVTLFPDLYRRVRARVSEAGIGPFLVEGRVEDQYGAVSVTATAIRPLGSHAGTRAA